MEFTSLFNLLGSSWMDDFLVWSVAATAGLIGLVALVNALDMFLEAEAN